MANRRRSLTDEEREQRRAEQRELVRASVEQLRSSDGWCAWLRARSTFHSYSLRNALLILHQHSTATHVAGFRAWLKLGYCVTKGSKAIRIWAPCPPNRKQFEDWEAAGGEPEAKPRTGWRLAAVFAQDQVAPLPEPSTPAPLEPPTREIRGATHEDLIAPLVELASEIGYTVKFGPTPRADGYCQLATRRIVIADRLAPNARLATLIHELGHALLAVEQQGTKLAYAQEELVVESVIFSSCQEQTREFVWA